MLINTEFFLLLSVHCRRLDLPTLILLSRARAAASPLLSFPTRIYMYMFVTVDVSYIYFHT